MLPHHHWRKGKDTFPQPAGKTLFNIAEDSNIFRLCVFKFCQELLAHEYLAHGYVLSELLLSLEKGIIEYQQTFLGSSPFSGRFLKMKKICSPEVQGCDLLFAWLFPLRILSAISLSLKSMVLSTFCSPISPPL